MAPNPAWAADDWMPSGFTKMASRAHLVDLVIHCLLMLPKQQPLSHFCEWLWANLAGRPGASMWALAEDNLAEFLQQHPELP